MDTTQYSEKYTKRHRRGNGFRPEPRSRLRPKSKAKTVWVIAFSEDGYEHCLTGLKNWTDQPKLRFDASGRPMKVVQEFEADTYEKARAVYEAQL